ncbi:ArsR/SmtB family transcription factor [Streptomyces sp. SBT349]|uniref:ArsR/SmtB family transcription factor n=1 Tax=Streptomyces sp. SBT349 TaxID=1580539 RepID=UPI000AD46F28|nr:helix-turn-helix domain-containing protein [Streptomyces sp. SBT349]
MIRIHLDELTLGRVRIAISPLWEAVSSLALTMRYRSEVPYPYRKWAAAALQRVSPALRQELTTTVRAHWATSPSSSLTPIPDESSPAIEEELSALRADGHDRFAHLMGEYWDAALAPFWPAMRGVLEEEILVRGRTLVTRGADTMLEDLGGRICWERPELSVPHRADLDWPMRDGRLIIVSTLFARGTRVFATRHGTAAFSYQARGAAVLGGTHEDGSGETPGTLRPRDRLTILLGRGRATVLRALHSPATTTGLAGSVGLAPSTVSQHLSVLSSAGLVRRYRVGPRVLYELGDSGATLLSVLDG